jgi:hypothetical protein
MIMMMTEVCAQIVIVNAVDATASDMQFDQSITLNQRLMVMLFD